MILNNLETSNTALGLQIDKISWTDERSVYNLFPDLSATALEGSTKWTQLKFIYKNLYKMYGNKIFDVLADSKSQTSLRSDHIRDFDRYLKLMFYVFIKLMVQWKDCK